MRYLVLQYAAAKRKINTNMLDFNNGSIVHVWWSYIFHPLDQVMIISNSRLYIASPI